MRIDTSFSGCSCGCTPYESATFEGEEPDIYIAIAAWAENFITKGADPFRRLSIPAESKPYILKYIELDEKIGRIIVEIRSQEAIILTKSNKKKRYEEAAALLGIDIPLPILEEMKKLEDVTVERGEIARLKKEKESLVLQRDAIFSYDYNKARKVEEEDEDEECTRP